MHKKQVNLHIQKKSWNARYYLGPKEKIANFSKTFHKGKHQFIQPGEEV